MKFLIILTAIIAVLLIDSLGAWLSRKFKFEYTLLSVFSFAVFFFCGYYSVRYTTFTMAALNTSVVGLADATLGWGIATRVKPYTRFESEISTEKLNVFTVFFLIIVSAGMGALGAYFG